MLQAFAEVAEADAMTGRRGVRLPGAIVMDSEADHGTFPVHGGFYDAPLTHGLDAMVNRILHDGLQQEIRNQSSHKLRTCVEADLETIREPDLLQCEVASHRLQLVGKQNLFGSFMEQGGS